MHGKASTRFHTVPLDGWGQSQAPGDRGALQRETEEREATGDSTCTCLQLINYESTHYLSPVAPPHCQAPSCPESKSLFEKIFPLNQKAKEYFKEEGARERQRGCMHDCNQLSRMCCSGWIHILEQSENGEIDFISLLSH